MLIHSYYYKIKSYTTDIRKSYYTFQHAIISNIKFLFLKNKKLIIY